MADHGDRDDDERIGYGITPSWTRWRKGESGNPMGRPKGTGKKAKQARKTSNRLTESDQILDSIGEEQIELSRAGKKTRLKKREALRHAQVALAMKGNPLAMRDLNRDLMNLDLKKEMIALAEAEAAEKAAQEKAKGDAAWFDYLVELKAKQTKAWADAEGEGRDEPDQPWPHPDDVIINHSERKAWVRGPWGEKDVRYFEYLEAQRDLMFLRDMIHLKTCRISEITGMTLWTGLWRLLDAKLPQDWQIAHKADLYQLGCLDTPLRTLRRKAEELSRLVDALELPERKVREGATYKLVNTVMKPLLQKHGFKSLAHFERLEAPHFCSSYFSSLTRRIPRRRQT